MDRYIFDICLVARQQNTMCQQTKCGCYSGQLNDIHCLYVCIFEYFKLKPTHTHTPGFHLVEEASPQIKIHWQVVSGILKVITRSNFHCSKSEEVGHVSRELIGLWVETST